MNGSRPIGAWVHAAVCWSMYGAWTLLVGAFIAVGALLPDPHRRFGLASLRRIWGGLLWTTSPFWRVRMSGLENIGEGPYVVIANHQSSLDIPLLFRLPLPLTVAARPGLFKVPVMGPFLRLSGQVNTKHFFEKAPGAIHAGLSVAVFPEGKRTEELGLVRFRSGAFELADQTGVPLLPVVLDGTRFILSRRGYIPWRTFVTVYVRVLPPIEPGPDAKERAVALMGPVLAEMQSAA